MSVSDLFDTAKRIAPDMASSVLALLGAIGSRDAFGIAVHSAALVRQVAGTFDDGGRAYMRHVIRELAEHEVSDALADALGQLEDVPKTPPTVT